MMMIHRKDRPAYYDIVDEDGRVLATVVRTSASRACQELMRATGKRLHIEPSVRSHRGYRPF